MYMDAADKAGLPALGAYSSAGEHFVDIEGVTGSIPVTPTISRKGRTEKPKAQARPRAVREEKDHEGRQFAPLPEAASPGLPGGAAQGAGLRHQQDPAPFQGPPGLTRHAPDTTAGRSEGRAAGRGFSFLDPAAPNGAFSRESVAAGWPRPLHRLDSHPPLNRGCRP